MLTKTSLDNSIADGSSVVKIEDAMATPVFGVSSQLGAYSEPILVEPNCVGCEIEFKRTFRFRKYRLRFPRKLPRPVWFIKCWITKRSRSDYREAIRVRKERLPQDCSKNLLPHLRMIRAILKSRSLVTKFGSIVKKAGISPNPNCLT